jgi:hypothetical protein
VHQFNPRFIEASVLEAPRMAAGFAEINKRVAALAPVLNSPTVEDETEVESSAPASEESVASGLQPIAATTRRQGGATYLFAVRMEESEATGTFRLKRLPPRARAEVLNEGSTLEVNDGRFSDDFQGYEVHLYEITG